MDYVDQSHANNNDCSRETDSTHEQNFQKGQDSDKEANTSNEVTTHSLDHALNINGSVEAPRSFSLATTLSYLNETVHSPNSSIPLLIIKPSVVIQTPVVAQPTPTSNLPSPISLNLPITNEPQSLFLQALSKLNESSLSFAITNRFNNTTLRQNSSQNANANNINVKAELTPPDSLTSAPPSYSFVLRQIAARRRPRLMGTFIPSPSFIQHTPPPNYAAAFDIYVDNPLPPPTTRVYNYGFTPIPVVCPDCGYAGITIITSKVTLCTHLCAVILCLFCCWLCAPLPYVLPSCKNVYHYCRNCRMFLGMYCPTNPDNTILS